MPVHSQSSLLLLPSLVQLQKCGSPAHMSQAKLKSLESQKEVRHFPLPSIPLPEGNMVC